MATRSKESARNAVQNEESASNTKSPLSPDLPRRLYYHMLKCRMVEQQLQLLARQGKGAGYCAAAGREASEVGATIDLEPHDFIAPSNRDFLASIMNGAPLKDVFAQICVRTKGSGCRQLAGTGAGAGQAVPTSTIAAQLNVGTGIALACKAQNKQSVVVAISDNAFTPASALQDALKLAVSRKLPVVYVIETDTGIAAATPELTPAEDMTALAQSHGLPCMIVDGNDAIAVYRVCYEARDRARQGYGPTLVECKTCRSNGHPVVDSEEWTVRDPLAAMEHYLRKRSLWDGTWKQKIADAIKYDIKEAMDSARTSPGRKHRQIT